jgi:hypothetical protein
VGFHLLRNGSDISHRVITFAVTRAGTATIAATVSVPIAGTVTTAVSKTASGAVAIALAKTVAIAPAEIVNSLPAIGKAAFRMLPETNEHGKTNSIVFLQIIGEYLKSMWVTGKLLIGVHDGLLWEEQVNSIYRRGSLP